MIDLNTMKLIRKVNLKTKEGIEVLEQIESDEARLHLVKKNPDVLIYASKYWYVFDSDKEYQKLVNEALTRKPKLINQFKDRYGLKAKNYLATAIKADPMVIATLSKENKEYVTPELFIDAFVQNPLVLSVKDLKCLAYKFTTTVKVKEKDKEITKEIHTSLRTECLKAIRLSEGMSTYHQGYDDRALVISKRLDKSKSYQSVKTSPALLKKFATLVNAMIKNNDQSIRSFSKEIWQVNNNKSLHKAVRASAEENAELDGLLRDLPELDEKLTKRLVITAIKVNPNIYLNLVDYELEEYMDDPTVKYTLFKTLKKQKKLDELKKYLDDEDITRVKNKANGVKAREKKRKEKLAQEKELEA